MLHKSIIAILPIKKISKRLPNKNFKMFHGKQLYEWALEACLTSKLIDETYISCSEDIKESRAKWIRRPETLNGDVELMEVMKHALETIGKEGDVFIQVQVNKPLIKSEQIDKFIQTFQDQKLNTLFQVQKINQSINWKYKSNRNDGKFNFKSCALAKIWDYETLKNAKIGTWGFGDKHLNYIVGNHHIEIDTQEDWDIAMALKRAGF